MTGLSHERLRNRPVQWPAPDSVDREERPFSGIARSIWEREEEEHPGTPRLYVDRKFNTPDGRARFAPTPHEGLAEVTDARFPLVLSTGRVKNQWHTMTRTGRSAKLTKGLGGPFVMLHPEAAERFGVADEEPVRVVSVRGSFVARAMVTEEMRAEIVFAPFHWGDLWTEGGSVNDATHDERDPVSHQPELKGSAVRVEPVDSKEATEDERATVEALSAWDGS